MKRWLIALAVVIAIGALAYPALHEWLQPHYQGRSAKDWAMQRASPNAKVKDEAAQALQKMGADAVPGLTELLSTSDKRPWTDAFYLGALKHLPAKAKRYFATRYYPIEPYQVHLLAAEGLLLIGPDARPAIPALIKALGNENNLVATTAGYALGKIGKEAVPPLLDQLKKDNGTIFRCNAYFALGRIGPDARDAVPALMAAVNDPDPSVRSFAMTALSKIAPTIDVPIAKQPGW